MPRVSPFHPSKKKISYSWRERKKESKGKKSPQFPFKTKENYNKRNNENKERNKENKERNKEKDLDLSTKMLLMSN